MCFPSVAIVKPFFHLIEFGNPNRMGIQSCIDIEAAIRDNRLDVGIFAPEGRLDKATAESVLTGIQQEMMGLVEDGAEPT
jgi:hypothetical protein